MGDADNGRSQGGGDTGGSQGLGLEGPQSARADTDGFWSAADWIPCRDSKARPVEPGTFPLVDRAPARVGRLRAYGNAIVPQVAAEVLIATSELVANRLKPVANGGTE
jgi:DNA (cytosine-5)-methyltransferase 1